MNGLILKRSCVNPVLITTFGLEPSGHKIMRVQECRPWSEAEGLRRRAADARMHNDKKTTKNAEPPFLKTAEIYFSENR